MLSPLQLVRRTPLSNCGACGLPTCLAFAAAVLKVGKSLTDCPFINLQGLDMTEVRQSADNLQAEQKDLQFIAFLKSELEAVDFKRLAPALGAAYLDEPPALTFAYLGRKTIISKNEITINGQPPRDHRDQILLYNYLRSGGGRAPDGEWLGLESLPNTISKIKTLSTYGEEPLARCLSAAGASDFQRAVRDMGGQMVPESGADLAARIPVLPMVPEYILFWAEEADDNFPARVKILFDHHILDFLDLESIVFSAERLTDRLLEYIEDTPDNSGGGRQP
ncbi:MAG TPA: DUF3786 domain-containing protein [Desulfobacterales bacterium]|nr:DUF3786 domain-containing protein [Desulfobacterales bacterium]